MHRTCRTRGTNAFACVPKPKVAACSSRPVAASCRRPATAGQQQQASSSKPAAAGQQQASSSRPAEAAAAGQQQQQASSKPAAAATYCSGVFGCLGLVVMLHTPTLVAFKTHVADISCCKHWQSNVKKTGSETNAGTELEVEVQPDAGMKPMSIRATPGKVATERRSEGHNPTYALNPKLLSMQKIVRKPNVHLRLCRSHLSEPPASLSDQSQLLHARLCMSRSATALLNEAQKHRMLIRSHGQICRHCHDGQIRHRTTNATSANCISLAPSSCFGKTWRTIFCKRHSAPTTDDKMSSLNSEACFRIGVLSGIVASIRVASQSDMPNTGRHSMASAWQTYLAKSAGLRMAMS